MADKAASNADTCDSVPSRTFNMADKAASNADTCDSVPSRILFASCTSQHHPQPLWPAIIHRNATAFVWAGDAVYADDRVRWEGPRRIIEDATPDYLRTLYQKQKLHPGYKTLLDTNISIFGTVDDHDYGTNNGDLTYKWKRESGMEYVDFLGLDRQSPMAKRAARGIGVYGVQVYNFDRPPGQELLPDKEAGLDPDVANTNAEMPLGPKSVAIFVLDVRSNKTPWLITIPERFQYDTAGDFLGETQWQWFETAIGRSTAAVNIVVTGLQVHADIFWDGSKIEDWGKYPRAQHRMYQALLQPNVQAPIIVSGDIHLAQLLRKDCRRGSSYQPLLEVTTSGMTHSWGSSHVCARANLNPLCKITEFTSAVKHLLDFAHYITPMTELLLDDEDRLQYSLELNFAEFEFDWERRLVDIRILGSDLDATPLLTSSWHFDELSGKIPRKDSHVKASDFQKVEHQLGSLAIGERADEWICVNYRGLASPVHYAFGVFATLTSAMVLGLLTVCIFPVSAFWLLRNRPR